MNHKIPEKSVGFFQKNTNIIGFIQDYIKHIVANENIDQNDIILFSDVAFEDLSKLTMDRSLREWNLLSVSEFSMEIKKIYQNQRTWYEPPHGNFAHNIKLLKITGKNVESLTQNSLLKNIFQEYQEFLKASKIKDVFDEIHMGLKNIKKVQCFIVFISKKSWILFDQVTIYSYINSIIKSFSHLKYLLIITDVEIQNENFGVDKINMDLAEGAIQKQFIQLKDSNIGSEFILQKMEELNVKIKNSFFLTDSYLKVFLKGALSEFHILYLPEFIKKQEFQLLILYGFFALNNFNSELLGNREAMESLIKSFGLSKEGLEKFYEITTYNTIDFVLNDLKESQKSWSADDLKTLKKLKKQHTEIKKLIKKFEGLESNNAMLSRYFFAIIIEKYELKKNYENFGLKIVVDQYLNWLETEFSKWVNFSSEMPMFKKSLELIWHMTQQEESKNKPNICDYSNSTWYYSSFSHVFYEWRLHDQIQNLNQ